MTADEMFKAGMYDKLGLPSDYNEAAYLHLNPDVATAVKARMYSMGWRHYTAYGKTENRKYKYDAANPDPDIAAKSAAEKAAADKAAAAAKIFGIPKNYVYLGVAVIAVFGIIKFLRKL